MLLCLFGDEVLSKGALEGDVCCIRTMALIVVPTSASHSAATQNNDLF